MSNDRAVSCFSKRTWKSLPLGLAALFLCAIVASAATYVRTTLQELTQRSVAIAEVEVIDRKYPAMKDDDRFPRTQVEVKVHRSLKGALPESFVLDVPGGIDGQIISHIPDGPDFRMGERAMVFIKEPEKGHFMVQDLGLGKFNVVERDNKKFVESPICPRAVGGKIENQKDLEANLMTRSIPYETFCNMVLSYASGKTTEDAARLAAVLPPSASHDPNLAPAAVVDFQEMQHASRARMTLLVSGLVLTLVALFAALLVWRRRRAKASSTSARTAALLMACALILGGVGGVTSHAFVQFDQKTIWDLSTTVAGKVENAKIIWKQSSAVSQSNSNCFDGVQKSFNSWEAVDSSKLAFTKGTTTVSVKDSHDAENIIAWTTTPTNDFSDKTLAITFSSFTTGAGSHFVDGDIIFNDRDFNWGPGDDGNSNSVSLHEIGHFIGLNHTTDDKTVMFPFDGGLVALSSDEVSAARSMYPGPADGGNPNPAPPVDPGEPSALADASPRSGDPDLVVAFDGSGTKLSPTSAAITAYDWDFGDGSIASGVKVSHTYTTVGTFEAVLTVTDANDQTSSATVEIEVGKPFQTSKASFKLNFKSLGKDSLNATISTDKLIGIKAAKGTGKILHGSVLVGDQEWLFDFSTEKLKSVQHNGPSIKVNSLLGTATISIKNTDLRDVLGGHGATDDTIATDVTVPLTIWFGQESNGMYIFGNVKFHYIGTEGKGGIGTF